MKKCIGKRIGAILLSSVMVLSNSSVMALAEDFAAEVAYIEVAEELTEVEEEAVEVVTDEVVPAAEETVAEEQILGDSDELIFADDANLLDVYATVKENWGVEISSDNAGMQMFPGTTATLTAKGWHTFPDENGEEVKEYPEMTYDWSVTNMDGTTKNCPVTITENGSSCEVTAKSTGSSYAVYVYCDGYWEGSLVAEGKYVMDVEHFAENFGVEIETSRGKDPVYSGSAVTLTAKGWHELLDANGLPAREYPASMTYEWTVTNTDGTTANCPVLIDADGEKCTVTTAEMGSDYAVDIYCDGYWEGNLIVEEKYTLNVTNYEDSWGADIVSDQENVEVFAGQTVELTANVWHETLNANGAPEKTYPEGLTYDWVITSDAAEGALSGTADGKKYTVNTKFGSEAYSVTAHCEVYQDGVLLAVAEAEKTFEVYQLVNELVVLNMEELSKLYPGEELEANAKLVSYLVDKAGAQTAAELDDLVTYRFTWKTDEVQITDVNGKVLSNEDNTGEVPFTLKKLKNSDACVEMSADMTVGGKVYTAVASKGWEMPSCVHDWDEGQVTVEKTCTTDGELLITCKNCKEQKTEVITADGHDFQNYVSDNNATCEADGTKTAKCANCDETDAVTEEGTAKNHSGEKEVRNVKEATCEEAGYTGDTYCKECGAQILTGTEIEAIGHDMGAWTVVSKATVWKAEQQKQTCKNGCGHSVTKAVGSKLTPTIKLTDSKITLKVKQSTTGFKVSGLANGDSIKSITLNKTKYVTLSNVNISKGTMKLTAKKKADTKSTTKLIITLASGLKKEVPIKVQKGAVKTTGITGVASKLTLAKGSKATLAPVKAPFTSKEKIKYSSSKKSVVKVTSKGVVTAVAPGTAKITVKSGKKKVTCTVTVPGIANVKGTATVKRKKSLTLKPKLYGINTKATFVSSDPTIARVSAGGKVTGVKKGTATITVKAGNYTVKCKVKVK